MLKPADRPCQAALLFDDVKLCREPSFFKYTGLRQYTCKAADCGRMYVPEKGKSVACPRCHRPPRQELPIRLVIEMCFDHTRQVLVELEHELMQGWIEMTTLQDVYVLTVLCKSCGLRSSWARKHSDPDVSIGEPYGRFCPKCGAAGQLSSVDPNRDYWELLGLELDIPEAAVKALFEMWLEEAGHAGPKRFIDFARKQVAAMYAEMEADDAAAGIVAA